MAFQIGECETYGLANRGTDSSQFCLHGGWKEAVSFLLTVLRVH
jgi:hypothetical protein